MLIQFEFLLQEICMQRLDWGRHNPLVDPRFFPLRVLLACLAVTSNATICSQQSLPQYPSSDWKNLLPIDRAACLPTAACVFTATSWPSSRKSDQDRLEQYGKESILEFMSRLKKWIRKLLICRRELYRTKLTVGQDYLNIQIFVVSLVMYAMLRQKLPRL